MRAAVFALVLVGCAKPAPVVVGHSLVLSEARLQVGADGQLEVSGSVHNQGTTTQGSIEFEVFDATGSPSGSVIARFPSVDSGGTRDFSVPVGPTVKGFRLKQIKAAP